MEEIKRQDGFCHHLHVSLDHSSGTGKLLGMAIFINLAIPIAQLIGGLYANSMALISDALHNFSDVITLVITFVAFIVAKRPATFTHSFGYKRAEVIVAFLNVILIGIASLFILKEAIIRLINPEEIIGKWIVILAILGILGNGLSAMLLHKDSKHNINIRSAFIHLIGDLLTSLAVLIGGIVIMFKHWHWIDPILSIMVVAFIIKNCWSILRESVLILMEATPKNVNLEEVKEFIENLPGVKDVHYLHAWTLHPKSHAFSCHIVVEDQPLSETEKFRERVERELKEKFNLNHPIIQIETTVCGKGGLLCELSCTGGHIMSEKIKKSRLQLSRFNFATFFFWLSRISFGFIFVYASIEKIKNPVAFSEVIFNYRLLPEKLINLVAVILPWIELVAGLAIITGIGLLGGLLIGNFLLGIFTLAIVINIYRGINIKCGCFSTEIDYASTFEMWIDVLRDMGLLVIGIILFLGYFKINRIQSQTVGAEGRNTS